jgi:hypothetical protein
MRNSISKLILAAVTVTLLSATFMNTAQANNVRDHRNACNVLDPANCRDHRGPVVVVPPPPLPTGPIVVVDPIPRPPRTPPVEPPHRPHHDNPWADDEGDYGISCGEGRRIVRNEGFRSVRAIDCSGDIYRYNAKGRRGSKATVLVNMDGDIVAVNYWAAR